MLAHVIGAVLASQARPIVLVLGHQAAEVRVQLAAYLTDADISVVENPAYREGMSTSLKAGLEVLQEQVPSIDSALILLGDQPLLHTTMIDTLITTRQRTGAAIVAPLYDGKRGNPVLFAASLFAELRLVTGDEGGRQVIAQHKQEVTTVELGSTRPAYDVDTWEAYQQVVALWELQQEEREG